MKIGDRVKHSKYGAGTIRGIMFEDSKYETYAVEFDISNNKFTNCLDWCKDNHGYFCNSKELEVIEDDKSNR